MRGLRILACGVALATLTALTIGLLQVLEVVPSAQENWIPLAIYPFLALAILSHRRRPPDRPQAPAQPHRVDPPARSTPACPPDRLGAARRCGVGVPDRGGNRAASPVRLAARRRVRLPGRPALVPPLALGRRHGDRELRVHDRTEAVRSRAIPAPNEDITNPLLGNAVGEFIIDTGIWIPFAIGVLASLFAGALAVILRFRRSVGVERLQMKWLVWGASLIPLVLPIDIVMSSWFGGGGAKTFALLLVAQFAFVAAIGIAVVRYRLYAIERLVNRTLVYVTLTLVLLAVYAAITIGLGVAVGGDSAWVVALATLSSRLRSVPFAHESRISSTAGTAGLGTRCSTGSRVRGRGSRRASTWKSASYSPTPCRIRSRSSSSDRPRRLCRHDRERLDELPHDERTRREIQRDDTPTAVLLHDPTLLERRDHVDGVLAAAALSIEIARLRVEVRSQLAEVQASRARIVEAGYEERRRLERDLHDGAQQRLVSLGVQVRRLQLSLPRDAKILSPALDQVVSEVGAAIADLRQIAAGVRPARLDEGLAAALHDLARPLRSRSTSKRAASASLRASRQPRTSWRARRSRTPSSTVRRRG